MTTKTRPPNKRQRLAQQAALDAVEAEERHHDALLYERYLSEVESAGLDALHDNQGRSPEEVIEHIERERAAAAQTYQDRLEAMDGLADLPSRGWVEWALKKILEARRDVARTKIVQKRERSRAGRVLAGREEFFLARVKAWFDGQVRDTPSSVRVPNAHCRIQARKIPPGVTIHDERDCCESLIEEIGVMRCLELGLLRTSYTINKTETKAFLEQSGISVRGATYREEETESISIVETGRDR